MRFRPGYALLLFALLAVGAFWARGRAAAVEERDLVPLAAPGAIPADFAEPAPPAREIEENEARSPMVRALIDALDGMEEEELSDEDRRQLRDMLMSADDELADSMGENSLHAILEANNRHQGLDLRRANMQQRPQANFDCCDSGSEQHEDAPQLRRYEHYQEFGTAPDLD